MNEELLLKLIGYATNNKLKSVNELFGSIYPGGYYSLKLKNKTIRGQRDPEQRLKKGTF